MTVKDKAGSSRLGMVRYRWTNETKTNFAFNTLLYAFPDACARLLAGDCRYLPKYMGFIFGSSTEGFTPPSWPDSELDPRGSSSWADIYAQIVAMGAANMQISPIGLTPSVSALAGEAGPVYVGNAVTFTGVTQSYTGEMAFSGEGLAAGIEQMSPIYQVVLLAKPGSSYIPLARVDLAQEGVYPTKSMSAAELAVMWQVAMF